MTINQDWKEKAELHKIVDATNGRDWMKNGCKCPSCKQARFTEREVDAKTQTAKRASQRLAALKSGLGVSRKPKFPFNWDEGEHANEYIAGLHAKISELEIHAKCHICKKPATCFGTYEGVTAYSCDDCCGHGCEDGRCEMLSKCKP